MWNRTSKQRKSAIRRRHSYSQERIERDRARIARTLERETRAEQRRKVIELPKQKPSRKGRKARA